MAVSHIGTTSASAASSNSISLDVDSTGCDLVHVFMLWRNDNQTVSTFTREGVAMTQVGTDSTTDGERISTAMRRSVGAGGATDTIAVTLSGSTENSRLIVTRLLGVDQTTPVVTADTNLGPNGGANTFVDTDATTVATDNFAISAVVVRDDVSASLVDDGGAATTDRDAVTAATSITTFAISFVTDLTVRYSWTEPGAGNWGKACTVVYAAAAGGFVSPPGNSTQFLNLLGVGT